MATPSRSNQSLKAWRSRATHAEELHDSWESTFKCRELHAKYVGTGQWLEEEDPDGDKYYVNLFFSGLETRKPGLVFSVPRFTVTPRPSRNDDKMSPTLYRAKLYQDTINTVCSDKRVGFLREALLALHESFFRFGVIEVGLKGDVIDNPRAGKPMLFDDETKLTLAGSMPVQEPEHVVTDELPFVRRIPASQVLVSISNRNALETNDWFGYWEPVRIEDIRANIAYDEKARKKVKAGGTKATPGSVTDDANVKSGTYPEDNALVKLTKIWDFRTRRRFVFCDGCDDFLMDGVPYNVFPLLVLKHHEILDSYYPIPPSYNWLPQQREMNDIRQMQRIHRKRFVRKYTILDIGMDPDELDKLESAEDGTYVTVPRHDIIQPLQDADLSTSIHLNLPATKEDFMLVSGITGERQGIQEAATATQANIIDANSRLRDGFTREHVANWVADIAFRLLQIICDSASLEFWIKTNVDLESPTAQEEVADIAEGWNRISGSEYDLKDALNYEVDLELETLSPVVEQQQKQDWSEVLGLIVNPAIALHLLASDVLLRKTLGYYSVTSEREISEIRKAMGLVQIFVMQREMLAAQGVIMPFPTDMTSGRPTPTGLPRPGEPGPQGASPGPTPGNPAIMGQLAAQAGTGGMGGPSMMGGPQ